MIRDGSKDGATFANWKWWPNTLKAHLFVQYVMEYQKEKGGVVVVDTDALNDVLFRALYEQGENLSLTETLVNIARSDELLCPQVFPEGYDYDKLRRYLDDDDDARRRVRADMESGRRKYKISGVPFFVIGIVDNENTGSDEFRNPPYGFSGAQSSTAFREILQELADEIE